MRYTEIRHCSCCAETLAKAKCSFKMGREKFYFCSIECRDYYSEELQEVNR